MFSALTVILVVTAYMLLLFALAQLIERRIEQKQYDNHKPWIYALSLAVYHTSWTFYGSVGFASSSGLLFLAVYLGAILSMLVAWFSLRRMVKAKNTFHITSIADFIATRYDRSYSIAALVTLIALIGIVPYIALQLTAIVRSFELITGGTDMDIWGLPALLITLFMAAFTIIFGVRRLDPTERHQGMIAALVAECLVKLAAFLIVGVFVTYWLYDGFGDIAQQLREAELDHVFQFAVGDHASSMWLTLIVLSFVGVQLLPRQFHVAVVENADPSHIRTAIWLFPLYMLVINLFVVPIAGAGLLSDIDTANSDYFVLLLPQQAGEDLITLIAFIGGFSAATGMILITTMTLATMTTNHLILPLTEKAEVWGALKGNLLQTRWLVVALILLASYAFARQFSDSYILVAIGLISFAAILQFAPAVVGALCWQRGNHVGALLGLSSGFVVWFYTLAIPAFMKQGWLSTHLLEQGPWGIALLKPEALFGLSDLPSIAHAVFWSLLLNSLCYVLGSIAYAPKKQERKHIQEFYQATQAGQKTRTRPTGLNNYVPLKDKLEEARYLLTHYVSNEKATDIINIIADDLQVSDKDKISIIELLEFHRMLEHALTGCVGSSSAHAAMEYHVRYSSREAQDLQTLYSQLVAEVDNSQFHSLENTAEQNNLNILEDLQRKIDRLQQQTLEQDTKIEQLERKLDTSLDKSHSQRIEIQKLQQENSNLRQQITRYIKQPQTE